MEQAHIDFVAGVLQRWNPLGAEASRVPDLDGYETEAIDILFNLQFRLQQPEGVVRTVLNQAFGLQLTPEQCVPASNEILQFVRARSGKAKPGSRGAL